MQSLPRKIKALDGHKVTSYGKTQMTIHATHNQGITRKAPREMHSVDIDGYDVILGYPWLRDVNPRVDWADRMWAYKEGRLGENVIVIPEKKVDRAFRKGATIFAAFVTHTEDGGI